MSGLNDVQTGPEALIEAIFERAWKDLRDRPGTVDAADAQHFLESDVTIENVADLGADPDYYRRMLDAPDRDADAELAERIRWLEDNTDMLRTEIAEELFGPSANGGTWRINQLVGKRQTRGQGDEGRRGENK